MILIISGIPQICSPCSETHLSAFLTTWHHHLHDFTRPECYLVRRLHSRVLQTSLSCPPGASVAVFLVSSSSLVSTCIAGKCLGEFFKDFIYLLLERREKREREKEKSIIVQEIQPLVAFRMPPARNLARNPGKCPDWESNQPPFSSQAGTQSTEPHQPGLEEIFITASSEEVHCKTFDQECAKNAAPNLPHASHCICENNAGFHGEVERKWPSSVWYTLTSGL